MSEAELSGRIDRLEQVQSYIDQQILLRPDIDSFSDIQVIYNQQFQSLADRDSRNSNRIYVLENKYLNQSIEISAIKSRISTGIVSGLVITGHALKGSITLTGQNLLNITSSGQTIIFNPGYINRTFSLADPQTGDAFTLLYNDNNKSLRFVDIHSVVYGTSPTVWWNLYTDTSRASTGNLLASIATSSETTGQHESNVASYSIPSGYFLWMAVTGLQGLPNELFCKISLSS